MAAMENITICQQYETTKSKLEVLEKLASLVADSNKARQSFLEDQLGRFKIWAANIGVTASGHASLDYRLRDGWDARKTTLDILVTLQDHAARAIDTGQRSDGPISTSTSWVAQILVESPKDFSDASASSAVSTSFHGTETESLNEYIALDPYEQQMRAIEQTIDRLYRLSLAIRRPSMLSTTEAAAKGRMRDEEGNDSEESFYDYVLTRLGHQFPDAKQYLLLRMARSITARRRRFHYRSRHQSKLAQTTGPRRSVQAVHPLPVQMPDEHSTVVGVKSTVSASQTARRPGPQHVRTSASLISGTSASRFNANQFRPSRFEGSLLTLTAHGVNDHKPSVAVPDPPPTKRGAKEFECPYCFLMLPIDEVSPGKWRRHVMSDLEPYICPFEDCADSHVTMGEYGYWLAHMKKLHTMQWSCNARQCISFVVQSRADWEQHMHSVHTGAFTEAQLPLLEKKARKASSVVLEACPLCAYKPSVAPSPVQIPKAGSIENAQAQSNAVVKHLATHLESSSQIALPWQDDFRQPDEDDRLSSSQVERDSLKDDVVPDVEELYFQDEHLGAKQHREQVFEEWLRQVQSLLSDKDSAICQGGDWTFIEAEKPTYYGHDRDPTLQTFLQKLYLDATPAAYAGRGPKLPAYLVPVKPVGHFFGRDYALQAMSNALLPRPRKDDLLTGPTTFPQTFAVYAPGGMGKTQISAQFVSHNRTEYDAVFWVHAGDHNKLAQGFQDIAVALGLVEETSADAKDLTFTRDLVKKWLLNPLKDFRDADRPDAVRASWLLVFDGVENPDVLNEFWPYNGPGSVLITSRSPFSWSSALNLAPFTQDEAIKFLLELTEKDASDEQRKAVGKVNDQLGGLPLALAQMAGLIQHKKLTFAEFLESYNEQEELLRQSDSDLVARASGYEHTLASVWAFENLAHGVPMLNLVSMLDPDSIPETLLTASKLAEPQESQAFPFTWTEYASARKELVACSLISRDKVYKRFSIHRLVQDVARARMSAEEFRSNFMTCVGLISRQWPYFAKFDWRHDVSKWTKCEPLFPHVARLKNLYHEVKRSDQYSDEDHSFARLLTAAGWYHHERGRSSDAKIFNNLAQEICESLKSRLQSSSESSHHPELDRILAEIDHNRGCIATEINEPSDALTYHTRFNALMQKELGDVRGGQDMRLAISWNELGNAHMLNQDWPSGQRCFEQSITLMKQLDNYEEILISLPKVNLGLAHWLQERYEEALEVLVSGLQNRELVYGPDDRASFITGRYLHAIGNVKASQHQLEESQTFHHRALIHYKYTLGNNHHRTADTLVKVGEHHLRRGQDETALVLLEAASKIYSSSIESTRTYKPERARALFQRSLALRSLDRGEDADRQLEVCFELYEEILNGAVMVPVSDTGTDGHADTQTIPVADPDPEPDPHTHTHTHTHHPRQQHSSIGDEAENAAALEESRWIDARNAHGSLVEQAPHHSQPDGHRDARTTMGVTAVPTTSEAVRSSSPSKSPSPWPPALLPPPLPPPTPASGQPHRRRLKKSRPQDLTYEDLLELVAFWSK